MVLQQIKVLLLGVLALFRRALCCFSRRRKMSNDADHQLHTVNVIVEPQQPLTSIKSNGGNQERDWNSWDDSPRTVEEHIEQYRQRMAQPPTPPKEEPEPDFFSELAPEIKPQVKYYMGEATAPAANQRNDFSRLQAQDVLPINVNADLEDWVDDTAGGWEELDTSQTKQIIREKRREMRHQRQPAAKAPQPSIGAHRLNNNDVQRSA